MTLAIMQPYLYPYLGYFQLLNAVDRFVVYDDVNFIKKGWVNRNNLLENGSAGLFTVPLIGASQNRRISEIMVANEHGWRDKLMRRIRMNYSRAPYFSIVEPMIESGICREGLSIAAFNVAAMRDVVDYIGIDTDVVASSTTYANALLKGQSRIIDICQREGANHYVNPIGGMDLYDKHEFSRCGIRLSFLRSALTPYVQFDKPFVPGLSILDVMMFNDRETIGAMVNQFDII